MNMPKVIRNLLLDDVHLKKSDQFRLDEQNLIYDTFYKYENVLSNDILC